MYRADVRIIDFHTHAFPEELADKALSRIGGQAAITPALDGRIGSLLDSMDRAGIERSIVLSIATRPSQFESILAWSRSVASERIVPFFSVHPGDPEAPARVRQGAAAGFKGLKLHPYYQDFNLDDARVDPAFEAIEETGLICVAHTGFDTAFPMVRKADPPRIAAVLARFPRLKLVATHLGAWKDWEQALQVLPDLDLWVDTSYSLGFLPPDRARRLILSLPPGRLLFGSDSPWADQAASARQLMDLGLEPALLEKILHGNAERLLDD
jgi:predicted TIM-barrel fold metal-dependent hydrolase